MAGFYLGGQVWFPQSPDFVRSRLSDAQFLHRCATDVYDIVLMSKDSAIWTFKPSMGVITGSLQAELKAGAQTESELPWHLEVSGSGAGATIEVNLNLREQDGGCGVYWTAMLTHRAGLLKIVPMSMLKTAAETNARQTWQKITDVMAADS